MSLFAPTSKSLSHTRARREANQKGTRGATLPGITEETMQRTLVANYWKIRERSIKYAEILNEGKRIRLITDAGTNITLSIKVEEHMLIPAYILNLVRLVICRQVKPILRL